MASQAKAQPLSISTAKLWTDLSVTEQSTALSKGVEIQNGGQLTITNQTLTFIDDNPSPVVTIKVGGAIIISQSNITLNHNLDVRGEAIIINSTIASSVSSKFIAVTGELIFNNNVTFNGDADIDIQAGGKLTIDQAIVTLNNELFVNGEAMITNNSSFTSWEPVTVTGEFTSNNSFAFFKNNVLITSSGSAAGSIQFSTPPPGQVIYFDGPLTINGSTMNFINADIWTEDIFLTNNAELNVENTKLDLTGFSSVSSDSRLNISDNSEVHFNKSSTINGEVFVDDATLEYNSWLFIDGGLFDMNSSDLEMHNNLEIQLNNGEAVFNQSNLLFGSDSRIYMTSSCNNLLTANGSTFEPSGAGITWKGIEVNKVSCGFTSQFTVQPQIGQNGTCTQSEWAGVLAPEPSKILLQGCTFKHASAAIDAKGDAISVNNTSNGGAVVRLRDCTFENCKRGVRIAGYYKDMPSASYIMTCNFSWDNQLQFAKDDLAHIELTHIEKAAVNIGGCHFVNMNTTQDLPADKGIGILALNASFNVSHDGDQCCGAEQGPCPDNCFQTPGTTSRNNLFQHLGIGIKADLSMPSSPFRVLSTNAFSCRKADFEHCAQGIFLEKGRDALIGDNSFTFTKSVLDNYFSSSVSTSPGIVGITLFQSSGNRVYDNSFSSDLLHVVSIRSENPDLSQTSFIRQNSFSNNNAVTAGSSIEVRAIDLYGNNNYLDITCNSFSNQVFDVRVNPGASLNDLPDMEVHGGSSKKYSNNYWSNLPPAPPGTPNGDWKTNGLSSNISNDVHPMTIYDGYQLPNFPNLRFSNTTYPNILNVSNQPNFYPFGKCGLLDEECVDCSTDCEKLEIKQVSEPMRLFDINKNEYFILYPNPTTGILQIQVNSQYLSEQAVLTLYDAKGSLIYQQEIHASTQQLDIKALGMEAGVYVLHLSGNKQSLSKKLIVLP